MKPLLKHSVGRTYAYGIAGVIDRGMDAVSLRYRACELYDEGGADPYALFELGPGRSVRDLRSDSCALRLPFDIARIDAGYVRELLFLVWNDCNMRVCLARAVGISPECGRGPNVEVTGAVLEALGVNKGETLNVTALSSPLRFALL